MIKLLIFLLPLFCSGQVIIDSYRFGVACTDIYAEGDAVDPCNETNSVGSWTTDGAATHQIINESDGDGGTYSLETTVPSAGFTDRSRITLPALTNNATYTIEARAKGDQANGYIWVSSGFDGGGFTIGGSNMPNGSYGNISTTGKISTGAGPVIFITSDDADPNVMNVAWIKITKTADP